MINQTHHSALGCGTRMHRNKKHSSHGSIHISTIASLFLLTRSRSLFPAQEGLLPARVSVRHHSRRSDPSASKPRRSVLPNCLYNLHSVATIPSTAGPHFARKGEAAPFVVCSTIVKRNNVLVLQGLRSAGG